MVDPYIKIQEATRRHQQDHGCGAYTYEDGAALVKLATALRPKRILELGTALGYTACCLASSSPVALVDTIDADATHIQLASQHIKEVGLSRQVTLFHGDFERTLKQLTPGYDLIFFDGFAPTIPIIRKLQNLLNSGGYLVCANIALADRDTAKKLSDEFSNPKLWKAQSPIEAGDTFVLQKVDRST
ncbi:Methyltransferase domain-containing protein [Pseudovibrio denitrificans]|uniref:Methyltransferase domain-containing protein n=1 Tax=Pseudovibrio denitrificans TaxID=258256 RepID=A0A1I7DS81_9HYPH|nr:methyltransferase domain-containing protein [Pseudovibrio denitrificans]SFU14533.1 Methyltransferase domain-containing protein [Pseudovibrio denitrificans]